MGSENFANQLVVAAANRPVAAKTEIASVVVGVVDGPWENWCPRLAELA